MNRDSKKKNRPYKPSDFYYYSTDELSNMPEPRYGAAMMALIEMELFPTWGLFVYNELKKRAENSSPPEVLCYQCEDAIILAPDVNGDTVSGMLIIGHTAANKHREMISPCGRRIDVIMPSVKGTFEATEEIELRVIC